LFLSGFIYEAWILLILLTYWQNTWNVIWSSDKCGKACVVKHCMCQRQQNSRDSVFWLALIMLCVMTLHNFPPFVGPNVISDNPTNWMSIHQLLADSWRRGLGCVCFSNGTITIGSGAKAVQSKSSGPVNGNECYFWRTTGCTYGDKCRNAHIPDHRGIDKKPWQL